MGACHGQDLIIIPFHGTGGHTNREEFYSWAPKGGGISEFIRLPRLSQVMVSLADDDDLALGFLSQDARSVHNKPPAKVFPWLSSFKPHVILP